MTNLNTQPDPAGMSPQQLAEACAQAMFARDTATQALEMEILEIAPGSALIRMPVGPRMIQGHNSCHGGYIFTLADSAFAFACNTYNAITLGAGCSIDYLAPAKLGDLLCARAQERSRSGRTGVYDVTIENQHGDCIALFRGKSHQVRGTLLPEPADTQLSDQPAVKETRA
ncbi:phenylacetic acid degradation protein PaaD [Marinobacterium aestuarii]|uniref:Phenylacetic acid degradation protein PaaD n=1 Tax=Marinobacterium aestuarii TaxID=1821621 RepID=A0A1A9EXB7_9GAMM|nr:hydroxyphenylacetyl-CoA thioesterase PaaI [Marinobacterium aestuarii]ANG62794.1 phenylacetic acid degradation protein PaaD [Marinobacterium aestuarii]